jgi:hypothetical protein
MDLKSHVLRKELQRDQAAQLDVLRLVDHTHAGTAELLRDATMRR